MSALLALNNNVTKLAKYKKSTPKHDKQLEPNYVQLNHAKKQFHVACHDTLKLITHQSSFSLYINSEMNNACRISCH